MSFPAYPAYKDSGAEWLGEVPEHWGILTAKRLFGNVRESAKPDAEQLAATQAYGVIPQKDFMEKNDVKVVLALSGTESFRGVRANDFVISLRSFQGGIEHSAYDGCVSPAYTVLRRRDERNLNPAYFKYLLKDFSYVSALQSVTTGIREGRTITYEQFGSLPLPVAPVAEQTQIARFLDHETARIDALIEEQQRLIELLKEKRQAVISHAVTKGLDPTVPMKDSGVEWLGEVPAHWTVTKLKFMTDQVVDCPHETPIYDPDGDYLVIRTADIDQGVLKPEQMYRLDREQYIHRTRRMGLEKNDVVYSREGERWGHAALIPQDDLYALGQRMMQLRVCGSVCPEFFMYQLNSVTTYRQGEVDTVGATAPHVNISTVINYCLMRPPIAEQREISQYLSKTLGGLDCLLGESLEMKGLLQERRSALISAAVTGKIDVRGWQPPASTQAAETAVAEAV
ncbi:restriction endonuclease subunit S [Stutzerimonas degradans]